MIPQELVDSLDLHLTDPVGPSESNGLRVFKWPEFAQYHALVMECSMRGDRLPKKNNVVIYISNDHEFRGFIMTNEMLQENIENVRAIIRKAAAGLSS